LGEKLDLSNGIMFHGGGWKKLKDLNIDSIQFKSKIYEYLNVLKIHDYYGMAEQAGSISIECKFGYLHNSIFSDILVRDKKTLEINAVGEEGLIQTYSLGALSYPGHNLLTDDIGVILGLDVCECGRMGKFFRILGRSEKSELRGCSDVYAYSD